MVADNPYAAPQDCDAALNGDELLRIKPSLFSCFLSVGMALPYLAATAYFFLPAIGQPFSWQIAFRAVLCLSCIYAGAMTLLICFESQSFYSNGIQIFRWSKTIIYWSEIESWKQNENSGQVTLKLKDGQKRYLNSLGPQRYNNRIVELLEEFVSENP